MDSLTEQEVLEQLLRRMLNEHRADELSRALIDQYGTMETLVESILLHNGSPVISDSVRMLLSMVPALYRQREMERLGPHPLLNRLPAALSYASALYAGVQYERIALLCLDKSLRLKTHFILSEGSLKEVAFYPRHILQRVISSGADAFILCHNHPNGWTFFSENDVAATRELMSLCTRLHLPMVDHLLIANRRCASMRCHTYIPEQEWTGCSPIVPPVALWRGGWTQKSPEIYSLGQ